MTTQIATARSAPIRSRPRGSFAASAAAGIAFVSAWVTGLSVWPSNLSVSASGAQVVSAYADHQAVAATQYVLVEGVAAIALAVVVIGLVRAAGRRGAGRLGRVVGFAGIGAVIVSLVECVLGLLLTGDVVPDREPDRAGALFHLINRLDGAKMLALAAMALAGAGLARRSSLLPRWLGPLAALLAVAMTASGVGFLLLNSALTQTAAASLLLLLIWVAGTGVALGRRSR